VTSASSSTIQKFSLYHTTLKSISVKYEDTNVVVKAEPNFAITKKSIMKFFLVEGDEPCVVPYITGVDCLGIGTPDLPIENFDLIKQLGNFHFLISVGIFTFEHVLHSVPKKTECHLAFLIVV